MVLCHVGWRLGHYRHCHLFLGSVGLGVASSTSRKYAACGRVYLRNWSCSLPAGSTPVSRLRRACSILAGPDDGSVGTHLHHNLIRWLRQLPRAVIIPYRWPTDTDIMNVNYYFKLLYSGAVYYLAIDNLVNYVAGPHLGKWKCLYKNLMFI